MIQRWKIHGNQLSAVTEPVLEYVLYTDHLAAIAEKDKEIERLKQHSCPEYVTMCNCPRCGGFAPKEYEKEDSDGK